MKDIDVEGTHMYNQYGDKLYDTKFKFLRHRYYIKNHFGCILDYVSIVCDYTNREHKVDKYMTLKYKLYSKDNPKVQPELFCSSSVLPKRNDR